MCPPPSWWVPYEVPYNPKAPNNQTKNLENSKKWPKGHHEGEQVLRFVKSLASLSKISSKSKMLWGIVGYPRYVTIGG